MKRILLSLALLASFYSSAQIALSQNFDGATFPPTGWTRSATLSTRPWGPSNVATTFPSSGSAAIATYSISNTSAAIDYASGANTAGLTSPAFSLAGATAPLLKFKVVVGWSFMIDQNLGDLIAQISTNGGTTWTTLWTEDTETGFIDDGDGNANTDLYNIVSVQKDLSAYAGQTNVQIRFQYTATDADAVSIDDVQVLTNGTLGTHEVSSKKASLEIYPNPTKGQISIKTDKNIKSSTLFDMTGKALLQTTNEKTDISSLPKGTYLLKIIFTDGTSSTRSIIKQ
ncbi:T9SS type A sorting domain-containing protein [Chryseobacterium jejuense]|uniref:Por secretion system C-terminal sorting domain n=1 Tax=Chryseobacterium jejuense TaxID=445960 RepID=A0A2X2XGQ7_CHRJE|nr:T9SS type A sorting domain-containing protein [Chryseobacterium jejuense]SDI62575.1 Por secretion system C-terminal sorting domain-containing protein [Chryseobacterium jejuense]SQB47255.1 Por secretion system C-terminal sorting domain [Chryseobacterium jejuense]